MTALTVAGTLITVIAAIVTGWAAVVTRRAEESGARTEKAAAATLDRAGLLVTRLGALETRDSRDRILAVLTCIGRLQDWTWAHVKERPDAPSFDEFKSAWRGLFGALEALPPEVELPLCHEAAATALNLVNDSSWDQIPPLPVAWIDPLMDATQDAFHELRLHLEAR